jgi:RimJ/RimL family protein N-acetyltransferase
MEQKSNPPLPGRNTVIIETPRLRIIPLTHSQLIKYSRCDNSLEAELGVLPHPRSLSPELKDALEYVFIPNTVDPNTNYLFYTLWTAIAKDENVLIGDLCFVGEPNDRGEVEIGYGTHPDFQGRGYMTELVGGIIAWAAKQPNIKTIVASTEKANPASHQVLIKNLFEQCGEKGTMLNWRRSLI